MMEHGKPDAVHAYAGWAGGVLLALFTAFVEKVVARGTKKDVRSMYVMRDRQSADLDPHKTDGV